MDQSSAVAKTQSEVRPKRTPTSSSSDEYRVVCVRMRSAELKEFAQEISRHELTNSMALRIAARRIAGFLETDPALRSQLEALVEKVGDLSGAIRAIHQAYLANGAVDLVALEAQRAAFGEQFAKLDALLRIILNVSKRRLDGQRMLSESLL